MTLKIKFYYVTNFTQLLVILICSDTMDSVKQSAALCLLRLYKTSPDLVLMGEWTSRVVHLLNDQHMVSANKPHSSLLNIVLINIVTILECLGTKLELLTF